MTNQRLSDNTYKLILKYEVGGGRSHYEAELKRPTWPEGSSGVTIGIGYDCGYNDDRAIMEEWVRAGLSEHDASRLAATSGITGIRAKIAASNLKDIVIPWEMAWEVFNETSLPKFIKLTLRAFPYAAEKLTADGFGALVSLVFNRGASMTGPRRVQMRRIKQLLEVGLPGPLLQESIAGQIREMIPLWEGTRIYRCMVNRRNDEADLMANWPVENSVKVAGL